MFSYHRLCPNFCLQAGADPNNFSYGLSPLAHAAKEGDTQFLNSLLNAGANPDLASMVNFNVSIA